MARGAKSPISKAVVYVVLLLLVVGLAGFGATNFGGSTRVLGRVGETEIPIERYVRMLQQELRAYEAQTGERIGIARAREMGLDRVVLQQLVATVALEDEARALGISVGDAEIARQIREIPAFQGVDGSFDREAYSFALERTGLSVSDFEEQLRDETARTLLQGALVAGIAPPSTFVDTLYRYAREARDLTLVSFGPDALQGERPEPTEQELVDYYEANAEAFTLPSRKRITYAWLTPEMLTGEMEVNEDALRRLYEERTDEYNRPERRLVERLVFSDAGAADSALAAIEAGDTDFDALVAERGLDPSDVDLGEIAARDLGPAAEPVFALDEPGLAGPAETGLGPALFRVNAILAAQETPFEEVRDELQDEYALSAASRAIGDEREPVADLLAGGATLEEIADETSFETGETVWSPGEASAAGADIDAYEEFRAAAAAAEPGDFPEVAELSDGGLFALRVDEVLEPELQPLDAVRAEVVEGWKAEALRQRLADRAESALEELRSGTPLEEIGGTVREEPDVRRDETLDGVPPAAIAAAFALEEGSAEAMATETGALLLRVDAVTVPGAATEEARATKRQVEQAIGQGMSEDITRAFTQALETQKGISLDQSAVDAALSQFSG